jgi:hypothetical protein
VAEPVFTSAEPLTEDRVAAALAEHGVDRVLICGDERVWLIAMRVVGLAERTQLPDTAESVAVIAPTDMVKLDDSLGAGVWGLR